MKTRTNKNILVFIGFFFIVSIVTIYSAGMYTSKALGNLAMKQFVWYIIGSLVIWFVVKLKNEFLYNYAGYLYVGGIFLLISLLLFGSPINNSKCWFVIPGIGSFQPSEFMKIFIMLSLARLIYSFRSKYSSTTPSLTVEAIFILKSLALIIPPAVLTFLQPDTGAVIIYFVIYIVMMFFSGIRIRWFLFALLTFVVIFGFCGCLYFFQEELFVQIFGTSIYYRIERLLMWKDGVGLQLENAIASIGSAGFLGHGFNKTPLYFPEAATDFIFAVFASNFGFLGVSFLMLVIFLFDFYIISLVRRDNASPSRYLVVGILGMLLFQQVQNIGMTLGLFPITGITLPFISYGGSSLISYMLIVGILINIASERGKKYIY